ncbi:ABC transporter permease [Robbsia sp. KACC 23696]|uniref:ABC transporter permease n=1 Tax=Robbsia sp. KACC 23696 TaxID=3149231 RepID=UPI00325B89A6
MSADPQRLSVGGRAVASPHERATGGRARQAATTRAASAETVRLRSAGTRRGASSASPAATSARPASAWQRLPRPLRRTLGPAALLAIWWVLSATGVLRPEVLAGPPAILSAAVSLWQGGDLPTALLVSLHRVALGLGLGAAAGIGLALLCGLSRVAEDLVDPPMQMLRTVPHIALIPLLIIWFGIGETPKITLIALASAFPLYLNVYAGIRNVDNSLIEAGRMLELSRFRMIALIVLPGALPNLLTGLRYALGASWLALVFGEQINATAGIGYLLSNARDLFQTDVIIVCLIVYALLGLAGDLIVRGLESRLLDWRPAFGGN